MDSPHPEPNLNDPEYVRAHAVDIDPGSLPGQDGLISMAYLSGIREALGIPGLSETRRMELLRKWFLIEGNSASSPAADPLDNPVFVFTHAPWIDPATLRGRNSLVLCAYLRRVGKDFGKPGLGAEQKSVILQLIREDNKRDMTPEQIARMRSEEERIEREINERCGQIGHEEPDPPE